MAVYNTVKCTRATSVTLLDRAGIPVHRIMQVSGHRNEGSVKVYCERQTLQQQKQCSEILGKQIHPQDHRNKHITTTKMK
jgi:hypothetical protein